MEGLEWDLHVIHNDLLLSHTGKVKRSNEEENPSGQLDLATLPWEMGEKEKSEETDASYHPLFLSRSLSVHPKEYETKYSFARKKSFFKFTKQYWKDAE